MMLDAVTCPDHGWLSHAALHEAAHAVFAIDLEFPFVDVSIHPPREILLGIRASGSVFAGGVQMFVADPTSWIPTRPGDALDFVLAGAVAEQLAFNHTLEASMVGDIELWRRGMGLLDAMDPEINPSILAPALVRVKARVAARYPTIRRVAAALVEPLGEGSRGRYTEFETTLVLTHADVRRIVDETHA